MPPLENARCKSSASLRLSSATKILRASPIYPAPSLCEPATQAPKKADVLFYTSGIIAANGVKTPSLPGGDHPRSEEHTSELQSLTNLVCRLLLEKKKP